MGIIDEEKRAMKGCGTAQFIVAVPDLDDLPVRVTREDAAAILTRYFFKASPRTLERAPLVWRRLNGKAHCETVELVAYARAVIGAAPAMRGGRSPEKRSPQEAA